MIDGVMRNVEAKASMSLGENLIFLISLPRSGSTLLQHIIAGNSNVASTAEPWILFPCAYALRPRALSADYNATVGQIGLSEFLAQLDDGEERYYTAVRKMALELYNAFLVKQNKKRFLDKTARYYLILPEMFRIFPEAHYVFLVRNPLAVFASILESMAFGNCKRLEAPGIRNDLLQGYRLIRQGIRYLGDDAIVVKYEDLVTVAQATVHKLCKDLELEFEPAMLHYGKRGVLPGTLVDPKSIHMHQTPVEDYVDAWKAKLTTRQQRHLSRAFLAHLGSDLITSLGYSYGELLTAVSEKSGRWTPIVKWDVLMRPPDQRSLLQRWEIDLAYVWQKQGTAAAVNLVGRRFSDLIFRLLHEGWSVFWGKAKHLLIMRPVRHCVRRIRQCMSSSQSSDTKLISADHEVVDPSRLSSALLHGWQTPCAAERQHLAYLGLLKKMYEGDPRRDFVVAAQALRLTGLSNPTVLEIGCGNGYYSEVLSHLTSGSIRYTGLDYSPAMIESARQSYADWEFVMADANRLPFADNSYDIAWSGTVLMHLVDYKKAIAETSRVARRFCVFHSTPVRAMGPTVFLTKNAYGTTVVEVIINQIECENLLRQHGLAIRHILESLPYRPGSVVDGTVHTLTYVCEKVGVK